MDPPHHRKQELSWFSSAMEGAPEINESVCVVRPALTVEQRYHIYSYTPKKALGPSETVRARAREYCTCSRRRLWVWCQARIPILNWLPNYSIKNALLGDVIAGVTVAIMQIPQGMAYSLLANLPPITGLYMAFFPVLIYFFLGTSMHISVGTYAIGSLMMSKLVTELSTEPTEVVSDALQPTEGSTDVTTYTGQQVSSILALVVGLLEVIFGLLSFGEVLNVLLSDMIISGFTTSVAFHVMTSQFKSLLGITGLKSRYGPLKIIYTLIDIFKNLPSANIAVILISLVCIAMLVFNNELLKPWVKKYTKFPVPMELIVVVLGTVASYYGDFHGNYNVKVVGEIPTGLPTPSLPPFELMPEVLVNALIIAVVGYTSSFSMAKIFSKRHGYTIDGTQEFYAQGASNMFGSFFSCGPVAASLSRSLIQEAVGSVTLLTALISCGFILLILLFIGPLFETLPNCVLSSIIVVSLKGLLLQLKEFKTLWLLSHSDAFIWMATFSGSVLLDIDYGLLVGVLASMLVLLLKSQRPTTVSLGRIPNTDLYLDFSEYPQAVTIPRIRIFKFCGSLHFANVVFFREKFFRKTELEWVLSNNSKKDSKKASENKSNEGGASVEDSNLSLEKLSVKNSQMCSIQEANELVKDAGLSKKDLNRPLMESNTTPAQDSNVSSVDNPDESPELEANCTKENVENGTPPLENDRTGSDQVTGEEIKVEVDTNIESDNNTIDAKIAKRRHSEEKSNISSAIIPVQEVKWVIVDFSGTGFVDVTGSKCLTQLHRDLQDRGISLCVSGASDRVMEMLERCGTEKALGREHFFHSTHDAVTVLSGR
ncbi:prestin-like [Palaemon carinicauda]|uniref:prestin-like n=1 Tax=Palaemon carinicauda TaxID=392227 RepID=UPI0035B60879